MSKEINGKLIGFSLIGILVTNFFFVIYIVGTVNNRYDHLDDKLVELNTQIQTIQEEKTAKTDDKESIDFLKEQFSNYKDFANSDRESFFNLISIFFVALGVLVTGGTIVLYWIFGQTKNEVKENANLTIKTSINAIEEKAKNKITSLIEPKIANFEGKYEELERFMDNQHSIRHSKVLVLCPDNQREQMEQLEVMRIRRIVGEVQLMSLNGLDDFEQKVSNGKVDIIIYRYEKEGRNQEESIRMYIQKLKDLDLEILVVVYAPFGNRVDGEDSDIINSYPFSVIANLPTSLTSNMISLANVLSYEKR